MIILVIVLMALSWALTEPCGMPPPYPLDTEIVPHEGSPGASFGT